MRAPKLLRDEHGAVLVEFGIVVPIMIIMFFAIFEFGFELYTLHALTAAAREGARQASVTQNITGNYASVQTATANAFNRMRVTSSTMTAASDVTVAYAPATCVVTVTARYAYQPFTPIGSLVGISNPTTLARSAGFRWEVGTDPACNN
jgi:Flp pilus assembly protein TadG